MAYVFETVPADRGLIDLDDPVVLRREKLRPSAVATRRSVTTPRAVAAATKRR